jgi:hypothetical protein
VRKHRRPVPSAQRAYRADTPMNPGTCGACVLAACPQSQCRCLEARHVGRQWHGMCLFVLVLNSEVPSLAPASRKHPGP